MLRYAIIETDEGLTVVEIPKDAAQRERPHRVALCLSIQNLTPPIRTPTTP